MSKVAKEYTVVHFDALAGDRNVFLAYLLNTGFGAQMSANERIFRVLFKTLFK